MRVVVSYDVSDDRRRRKVAKIMEGVGYRVQYSVFECELDTAQQRALQQRLRPLISKKLGESVRFYPLCAECRSKLSVIGQDNAKELGAVLIV
jgi:CRISPR-associated protein Cas2